MTPLKSGDQEVRVGEVFMECAEKEGSPGFGFLRQGANCALWGRKRLPEEKPEVAGPKDGGWVYTHRHSGPKMQIPALNQI
jgi:hypothetical protein